jgi:hypothetical protein
VFQSEGNSTHNTINGKRRTRERERKKKQKTTYKEGAVGAFKEGNATTGAGGAA